MDPMMEELAKAESATQPDVDGKRHCPKCGSEVIEPGRDLGSTSQIQTTSGAGKTSVRKVRDFLSRCKNGHAVKWKLS